MSVKLNMSVDSKIKEKNKLNSSVSQTKASSRNNQSVRGSTTSRGKKDASRGGSVYKAGRTQSLQGSLLESKNKKFLKDILQDQNQDKFLEIFKKGSEAPTVDTQKKIFERKQQIFVNGVQFDFSTEDKIFTLDKICTAASEFKSKKLKNLADGKRACDICRELLHKKVKVKQCHFCAFIGCGDCINKKFPFPANNKDYANRGKICKVCENKFYIRKIQENIYRKLEYYEGGILKLNKDVSSLQECHNKVQYEIEKDKQELYEKNDQFKERTEQYNNAIYSCEEKLERQVRENEKLQFRIDQRKQDFIAKQEKIKERNIQQTQEEIQTKERDLSFVQKHFRQFHKPSTQPFQGPQKSIPLTEKKSSSNNPLVIKDFQVSQTFDGEGAQNQSSLSELSSHYSRAQVTKSSILKQTPKINNKKSKNKEKEKGKACGKDCILF